MPEPSPLKLETPYYPSEGPPGSYRLMETSTDDGQRYRVEELPLGASEWKLMFRERIFPAEQAEAEKWLRAYVREYHGERATLETTPPDPAALTLAARGRKGKLPPPPYDYSGQIAWGVFRGMTGILLMLLLVNTGMQCLRVADVQRRKALIEAESAPAPPSPRGEIPVSEGYDQ